MWLLSLVLLHLQMVLNTLSLVQKALLLLSEPRLLPTALSIRTLVDCGLVPTHHLLLGLRLVPLLQLARSPRSLVMKGMVLPSLLLLRMDHNLLSLVRKVLHLHSLPHFLPKVLNILVTCGLE